MNIDWTSQLLAAFSTLVLGFIWYGLIFKDAWLQATGLNEEKIKNGIHPAILYGSAFVLAFLITMGLHGQIVGLHSYVAGLNGEEFHNSFWHGMQHALKDSIFYGAIPVLITNSLFDQRKWKYILINVGYWLVAFGLMGGIIGAMA